MSPNPTLKPDSLREQFQAAHRFHQQGRLAEAEAVYGELLARSPGHPELLRLLGLLKYQAGDAGAAVGFLRRAVEAGSHDGRAQTALGCILGETGNANEAIACLQEVVSAHPQQQTALFNLGMLLMNDPDRLEEASGVLDKVVGLDDSNDHARGALARVLLCLRRPQPALEQIEQVLARNPGDVQALAHKTAALSLLGDDAGVAALVDLDMLHIDRFEGGGGFADSTALNARLAAHILEHPTLGVERTTRNGMDTDEILDSSEPAIVALVEFVKAAVEQMIHGLSLDPAHPFPAGRPERWYLSGWGVRMWRGGFQIPHYHKDAWISGVYYVQLPPVVHKRGESQEGWIEFGRGPGEIYHDSAPQLRRVQPEEGKLIAFPSYFWHCTLPFEDDHERLCISFNVVPGER